MPGEARREFLQILNELNIDCPQEMMVAFDIFANRYDFSRKETSLMSPLDVAFDTLEKYINDLRLLQRSEGTIRTKRNLLKPFFNSVCKPLRDIQADDVRAYLYLYQKEHKISDRTLETMRVTLKAFFNWCVNEDYIDKNPMRNIKPIKCERKKKPPLADTEVEMLRNACVTKREKFVFEFMMASGCRISEFCKLKVSDINFLINEVKLHGKGKKDRTSIINAKVEFAFNEYMNEAAENLKDRCVKVYGRGLQESEYALTNERKKICDKPIDSNTVRRILNGIVKRSGIDTHATPHTLRHTFATNLIKRQVPIYEVSKLLGHSSVATTETYIGDDALDFSTSKMAVA